jgi:hypothetical protein
MAISDINVEELGGGANTEENTGAIVNSEIYVAKLSDIESLATPKGLQDTATANAEYVTIADDHVFKTGKGFTVIKAIIEKNSFEGKSIGSRSARSEENKLTINIVGSAPEIAGWLRRHKNEDVIVLFKTFGRGDYRQIGSVDYAGWISDKTTVIGETVEGDAMRTIVIGDKQLYEAPYYEGARVKQADIV